MAAQLRKLLSVTTRQFVAVRNVSRSPAILQKSATISSVKPEEITTNKLSGKTHAINNFEKKLLVWTGKYKSIDEVPSLVAPESVEKARNKARIRVANIMMILTAFGCFIMVISGKKAAERGESMQKTNLEWHRRINEDMEKQKH